MASVPTTQSQEQPSGKEKKASLKPILPPVCECIHNDCFCEENIWKLCQHIKLTHPSELSYCYVVFVSNDSQQVPLWKQKAGRDEDKLIIWDYHVILLYHPDERCVVYDMDSDLPFPTYFHKYVTETFRTDHILHPKYFRYFRVVPAPTFLQHFASDRRHMRKSDGTWIRPPPPYAPISTPDCVHNLHEFMSMKPHTGIGEVLNLKSYICRFHKS